MDIDIERKLVSKKIYFGEKNYKYFIGYLHNDNKVKPSHIMLSKRSAYEKVMMDKLNGCIFVFLDWKWWLRKIIFENKNKMSWWWSYRSLW